MNADRTLPADLARELAYTGVGLTYEGWTVVLDEHIESGRWEELRDLVIRDSDGRHYLGSYRRGLTEYQDTRPWEAEAEAEAEAVFEFVVPVERTVVDYVTPEEAARARAGAVETHDGAPADTSIARAQVHATLAVAEQLAQLTKLVAAQHGPADEEREGCVDHLPVAHADCRECAQVQGGAR